MNKVSRAVWSINGVFSKDVASECTARRWFKKFRSGNFNPENEPRDRPVFKMDNDELQAIVEGDTCQTMCELEAKLRSLPGLCVNFFGNLTTVFLAKKFLS